MTLRSGSALHLIHAVLLTPLLACAACGPPRDGKKYAYRSREHWPVGETVVVEDVSDTTFSMSVTDADGKVVESNEETMASRSRFTRTCLEADASGALVRSRVAVTEWSQTANGIVDRSLEGCTLEVRAGRWTFTSGGGDLSDAAKHWLEVAFGPGDPAHTKAVTATDPGRTIAVGESWEVPSAEFVREITPGSDERPVTPVGPTPELRLELVAIDATPAGEAMHTRGVLDTDIASVEGVSAGGTGAAKAGSLPGLEPGSHVTLTADHVFCADAQQRWNLRNVETDVVLKSRRGCQDQTFRFRDRSDHSSKAAAPGR